MNVMKYPTNIQLRECIKNIGGRLTHPSKQECIKYIGSLYWYKTFPWREEQQQVFNIFIEQQYKHIVIQGIFGVGKSQMLLGLLFMALLECDFHYSDILYTAFNVCVKNEIKKKLGNHGFKKIKVSTFDSIVYTLCKYNDMKDYNEPNYEGRRKFLYNSQFKTNLENFKLVILDECQDLEIQALDMLKRAFPNAIFIFAGDVLQSIQKEPKESVLWQIMMNGDKYSDNDYKKIFMYQTPRVPKNILNEIRVALGNFYPELTDEFSKWKSQNTTTDGKLAWHQFSTYKEIFDKLLVFCSQHDHKDIMILTFSSSITVRGTLGDVSRIRNFLKGKNIPVNHNHKMMDHDKVFLSTANSSKGLERKFVFIILSFPLEKAFLNFSNDLVMNLLTVALSRAQQTIDIYTSKIIEKSSQLLQFYKAPEPTIHYKYVPEKGKKEIVVSSDTDDFSYDTITTTSHSVVETLNLGILKYSTLNTLKNHAKVIFKSKLTNYFNYTEFIPKLTRDEERVLAGLLIEHLITSQLQESWPFLATDVKSLSENPNYKHCIKKIQTLLAIYDKMKSKSFIGSSIDYIFSTLHIYSQLHLALAHRIFVSLSDFDMTKLKSYWQSSLYNSVIELKMATTKQNTNIKVQSSCKMPYMTGIIDVLFQDKNESYDSFTFWEIKASTAYDWVDNALAQVMLYVLMNAKSYCSVVLINPFKNIYIKYAISIPNINTMRHIVVNDCIIYNVNSYLAKNLTNTGIHGNTLNMLDSIFVQIQSCSDGNLISIQVCKLFSPTKIDILYDKVGITCNWVDDKESEMYKLGKETFDYVETVLNECKNICSTFKHIYCSTTTREYLKDLPVNFYDTESNNNITNIVQLSINTKFVY
jgi:hypothetical protein